MKLGIITLAAVCSLGCLKPAKEPVARHLARGAILAVAQAVKMTDHICAEKAEEMVEAEQLEQAIELANKCAKNYKVARSALLSAAYAVDAWGTADEQGKAVCATQEGAMSLRMMVDAVTKAGVLNLPHEVNDAFAAATWLAEQVQVRVCK